MHLDRPFRSLAGESSWKICVFLSSGVRILLRRNVYPVNLIKHASHLRTGIFFKLADDSETQLQLSNLFVEDNYSFLSRYITSCFER